MPRVIRYELNKLFSLPVLVLWAAAAVILAAVTVGRYTSFVAVSSMSAAQVRSISMEYAGPLDQALADRALKDWRALPDEWSDREPPETRARRTVLSTLNDEFAAAGGMGVSPIPDGASADAAARLTPLLPVSPAPFVHGYWEGWRAVLAAWDGEAAWLCAVMAAFGASSLFSGENAAMMAACVLTTRNGRGALALGKLAAAAIYALLCAGLCMGLPLALGAAFFGLQGGELPAQYAGTVESPIALPLTLAQYAGLRCAMAALGALALAGCAALFSAAIPSVTTPAVATLGLFVAPTLVGQLKLNIPVVNTILNYLPTRLLLARPGMKTLAVAQLWDGALWQTEWLCILWAAAPVCLGVLAARRWMRMPREETITQD